MIPIIKKYGLIAIFLCTLLGFIFVFSSLFFTYYYGSSSDNNTSELSQILIPNSCDARPDPNVCRGNQAFSIICIITSLISLFIVCKYLITIWLNPVDLHEMINDKFNSGYSVIICIGCLFIAAVSQIVAFSLQIIAKEQTDILINSEFGIGSLLSFQGTILYSLGFIALVAYIFIHYKAESEE